VRRLLIACFLCAAAIVSSGCGPREVLCTISCPVYQPPEKPDPAWPRQCGGQRDPVCYSGTLGVDRKAASVDDGPSLADA
jgi:hypothetical protein